MVRSSYITCYNQKDILHLNLRINVKHTATGSVRAIQHFIF